MIRPQIEVLHARDANAPIPRVSVAISTYQRAGLLRQLFEALSRQTLSWEEFEVVIVDNGSTDKTRETIPELARQYEIQVHALRIHPNRGPAAARNVAWRHARAETVAFTDDDCTPTASWLYEGLRAMSEKNHAVIVGRTLPDPNLPIGPFSRTIRVVDVNWLPTCNVFYRRSDLECVGGFDEAFLEPGCEDTDLAYRVRARLGRGFRFAGDALVYHDVRPSRFADAAKETLRWYGVPRLFKVHPEARSRLHRGLFWKPSHPKVLLATFGVVLGVHRRRWLVLALPWIYYRTRVRRPLGPKTDLYRALPGTFVTDLLETMTMVRGSLRSRTIVL